jgi:hypothetical protein
VIATAATTGTKIESPTITWVQASAVYASNGSGEHALARGADSDQLDRNVERL